jgi:hypothetical protein
VQHLCKNYFTMDLPEACYDENWSELVYDCIKPSGQEVSGWLIKHHLAKKTLCYSHQVNPLKHSGNCVYHLLNIHQLCILPTKCVHGFHILRMNSVYFLI